ncbi:MAG: 3-methyl-2-oxobutanoate hydroxymethyltransferase [Desulfobacteraceae bacterium]|nr:3-methyl-2-oxobutanoate hydroxymethyltransferase [Desulfobacteraceae bacterium]
MAEKKFTIQSFKNAKKQGRRVSVLTAYDYTMARLLDQAGVDCLLVGDSLAMVMLGYENTLQVTMDDMIHHTKAVARGNQKALLIGDMPFMSYHVSIDEAVRNAGRFVKEAGAHAVKLEGSQNVADKIRAIIKAQIPVIGHLGLTPQSVNAFGGFKIQGKDIEAAHRMIDDALLLQDTGVSAIVLECVPDLLAKKITETVDIPTIGIGAGVHCDGQVLVIHDLLGLYPDMRPKFVKTYDTQAGRVITAVKKYIEEVSSGQFPAKEHTFAMDPQLSSKL